MEIDKSIRSICRRMLLPEEVANFYVHSGIREVYEWQAECVSNTRISVGQNLIYCAPTSGGKTLVAELVILMNVIALRKKVIFVLPFVSLVVEKERYFKSFCRYFNRRKSKRDKLEAKGYHGDINWHKGGLKESIIICTIEKVNNIVNALIQRGQIHRLGAVVVDEIHTLGDSFNGFLLEILIRYY